MTSYLVLGFRAQGLGFMAACFGAHCRGSLLKGFYSDSIRVIIVQPEVWEPVRFRLRRRFRLRLVLVY